MFGREKEIEKNSEPEAAEAAHTPTKTPEPKLQLITAEQFLNFRLDEIEKKLDQIIKLAEK